MLKCPSLTDRSLKGQGISEEEQLIYEKPKGNISVSKRTPKLITIPKLFLLFPRCVFYTHSGIPIRGDNTRRCGRL